MIAAIDIAEGAGLLLIGAGIAFCALFFWLHISREEREKSLVKREAEAEGMVNDARRATAELEERAEKEAARLSRREQELNDEHERKMAAVRAVEGMLKRSELTDTSHAGVSQYMRNAYRQGAFVGAHLRVMYLLSTDGFLMLRWEVDWPAAEDAMVTIFRNGMRIRTDWGRNGEHKEHVSLGARYRYRFTVHDPTVHNRKAEEPLLADIVVPSAEVWDSAPPGSPKAPTAPKRKRLGNLETSALKAKVGTFVAAENAAAKLRNEVEKVLRKQGVSDDEFEDRMSRLDGRISEIREEIGV